MLPLTPNQYDCFKQTNKILLPISTKSLLLSLFTASGKTGIFHSHRGLTFIYSSYTTLEVQMGLTLSGCECTIYFQIVQNVIHSCFTAFSAPKGVNHCLHQWKPAQASKHLRWYHCHQKQHPGWFPPLRRSFPFPCLLPLPSSITSVQCHHFSIWAYKYTNTHSTTDHHTQQQGPNQIS